MTKEIFTKQYNKAVKAVKKQSKKKAEPKYNSGLHHSLQFGYQNPVIAKKFAKYVVSVVENRFPQLKNKTLKKTAIVNLYAIDGSSVYLTAFVKMLRPKWRLVTINRKTFEFKGTPDNSEINIFIDDYISQGRATADVISTIHHEMEEENFWNTSSYNVEKLVCIFIGSTSERASRLRAYIKDNLKEEYVGDKSSIELEFFVQSEGETELKR